jgi:hypothetical protein
MDEISSLLGEPPDPWIQYYMESDDESDTSSIPSSPSSGDDGSTCTNEQVERAHAIQKKIVGCHDCTGEGCAHAHYLRISEAEALAERFSAQDVLKHDWIHTRYDVECSFAHDRGR